MGSQLQLSPDLERELLWRRYACKLKIRGGREAMAATTDFDRLIGRCRCADHANNYVPQSHNRSRTYYFLTEEHVPAELLCGACMQSSDKPVRGGLVVSEESKRRGVVVFQAFAAYRLTTDQISNLRKIWPRR